MTTNDEMTFKNPLSKLFELGQTVITSNAKLAVEDGVSVWLDLLKHREGLHVRDLRHRRSFLAEHNRGQQRNGFGQMADDYVVEYVDLQKLAGSYQIARDPDVCF